MPTPEDYQAWKLHAANVEAQKHKRQSQHWVALEHWCVENGWSMGCEVGVQRGWTTFHLLDRLSWLSMVMVDPWMMNNGPDDPEPNRYAHIRPDFCARSVKERSRRYGDRCQVMRMTSVDAAEQFQDGTFDFVFIDDDHSYEGAKASIEAWLPKVREGGWLIGHDVDMDGVREALNELFDDWEETPEPARKLDTIWRVKL